MFNLSGSELIFLVLIALVVLGPDKLPEAMRKAGKAYADFKKMTTGFQSEMKSVLDEPMRELRETAELAKKSAMWDANADTPASTAPISHSPANDAVPVVPKLSPAERALEALSKLSFTDAPVSGGKPTTPVAAPAEPEPAREPEVPPHMNSDVDSDGVPSA